MKIPKLKITVFDILFAVLSGGLTALSLPKFDLSFLAWVSLIPLFFLICKKTPKQAFTLGWIAGISFYAILIYWIPAVPAHYGNLSLFLSLIIYMVLVLFLSLFWAFFSYFASKINKSFPRLIFILLPFLWVSFEYIITHIFTGFPWGLIGYSTYENIYFIQIASITGIYGLSFLLVLFQSLFVLSIKFKKKYPFFIALILILLVHLGGFLRIKHNSSSQKTIQAAVIQGNVSSDIQWNQLTSNEIRSYFDDHMELSTKAISEGAQIIIWPEFTVPLCFSCNYGIYREFQQELLNYVNKHGCTLVVGTNEKTLSSGQTEYHNTALCIRPDLSISHYYKNHLVPFGEYIPYKNFFSFIKNFTHAIGEITPGKQLTLHKFNGYKFATPICFEIIFPDLVRRFTKKGANFLVTITNDGWYGESSAPFQHFSMAVLRAVENRRYLLRAATTGISGIIDPYGRIVSKTSLMTKAFLVEDISAYDRITFYVKYGDYLSLISLTLTGLFFILAFIKR
ncbi:MAG: apolipoprotein N-acyltransferase [Candidatus Aminicenantaceae bacterium]